MIISKTRFISIISVFCVIKAVPQSNSLLYYSGYGRALLDNSMYDQSSQFVKDDTSSIKRKLDGNFVFDLGINVKPNEMFKANTILRLSNEFGGFYSSGSIFEFRQIQIQTILAKKVLLDVGDLDLSQTKYTLYNSHEPTYSPFEAEAFKIKRGIVHYDNFNNENMWRLQGFNASTKLNFSKIIRSITINGIGTRIRPSDFLKTQDRLLYGSSVKVKQKYLDIGLNYIGISDIEGTVNDTVITYKNNVLTGDYKISVPSPTMVYSLIGEVGTSRSNLSQKKNKINLTSSDVFFETGFMIKHKYIPVSFTVTYSRVGPEFYSPGAQTRRIFDNRVASLLPDGLSGNGLRSQNIFDRMSDLRIYNRSISTTLMYFNPSYDNTTPYGAATPNRQGFNVDFSYGNKDSLLLISVNSKIMSEVIGVGIKEKRNFLVLNPGMVFNVNRLFNINRLISVGGAYRYEKTNGVESAGINLTSNLIDGSLAFETITKLDLIGGLKYLSSNGKEFILLRDGFNKIYDYQELNLNFNELAYTFGLRYRLTQSTFVSANAYVVETKNTKNQSFNYKINQYYFCFILRF